jgi:hypothetical protein
MDSDTALIHLALAGAGIAAGFLNTMAGGGSMLTLPVLMMLGLPADLANGTNRLSIVSQSISGALGFRRAGKLDDDSIGPVLVPTALGALGGALAAAYVPPDLLKHVLLGTMLAVAVAMLLFPNAVIAPVDSTPRRLWKSPAGLLGLFAAGVYGGFVQAGVGFVLIAVLGGVLRYDLVSTNALKLVCTLVFGLVGVGVFAVAGQVVWLPAALLAVYTVIGSQLGVRFALHVSQGVIRWIIFVAVAASCAGAYLKG